MLTEEKRKMLDFFAEGRKLYKLMKFAEAQKKFAEALTVDKEDGPSKVYFLRCKYFLENPPGEDWDGVFVMKKK